MSNARRSIARLRAEKEEGLALRDEVGQSVELCRASFSRHVLPEDALEKVTRACTLLVNAAVLDRAVAHGYKAAVLGKVDRIGEALAAYREAQQLY